MPTARVLTALSFVLLSGVGRAVPLPFTPTERGYTTTMGSCPALVDEGGLTLGSGRLLLEGAAPLALVPSSAVPIHYRVGSRAETVLAPTALSYAEPWPGIELMLAVTAGGHKRDLIVEPGADPSQIAFIAEGLDMGLEDDGSLHLSDGSCTYLEGAPVAWQVGPDGRVHVPIRWALSSPSRATFELGAYDPTRTLFIDPLIPAGGLFGPTLHEDAAYDVVIAPDGTTYVVGGAHPDPNVRGTLTRDAFVLALAPDRSLRWLTWYGGTRDNLLSPTCQAYATPNDPNTACITWGAHPSGLGGNDDAIAAAIVDDRLAVAGHTFSTDLPTLGAFIATAPLGPAPTTKGRRDGFLLILDRATGAPVMASYLGGDSDDLVSGIHATADGWVTVLGGSSSPAWGTPLPDPVPTPYLDFYAYAFTVSRSSDPERWVPTEIFGDAPLLAVQPPGRAIFNGALTQVEDTWLLGDHRGNAIRYKAFSKKTDYLGANGGAAIIHAFDLGTEQDGRARTAIVGNAVGEVGGFDGLACSVTEPTACAGRPCGMTDAFVAFLIGDSCDNVAYIGGGLGDVLFGAARARYAPDRDFLVLAGRTASSDLATRAAIQPRAGQPAGNGVDAFYAVVDVETQALRILSYLGGAPDTQTLDQLGSDDVATAVSLGPDRQATVVGMTRTLTRGDETLFVRRMGGHTGLHQTEAGQAFVARFPVEVADLAVTLDPETMVLAHEAIRSVTLTLSNSGTVEATHVSVLVDFQRVGLTLANTPGCTRYQAFPWTWMCVPPGGRLASGASHTFTLAVKAPATDGTYDIQTIARTATHDPNSDNDNAAATVKVGGVDFQPLIRPGEAMSSPVVVSPLDAAVVDVSALNYGPELARPRLTVSGSSDLRVTLGANASTCTATRCGVEDCLPVTCDLSAMNPSTALAAEYERQLSLRVENPPRTAEVTYVLTARTTALDGKTDLNPANDAATLPITFRYPDVVAVSAEPNPKVVAWGSDTTMLTLVGRDDGPGFDEGGLVVSMKFSPFAPNTVPETCDVDVATSVISCTLPRPPQGLPVGQLYSVQFGLTAPGRDEGEVAREVSLPVQWRGASVPEDSKPTNNLIQAKLWLGAVDVRVHPPEPLPTLLTHKVVETTWGVQNHSSEVARDVVVSQTFSGPPGTEIVLARVLGVDCPVASSATVTTVTCTIPEIAAGQRVNMLVDVKALGKGEIGHTLQVTTPVANASAAMFPSTRKFIAKGVDLALELQSDVTQLIRDETGTVAAIKVTNAGPGATPPEGATLVIDIPIAVKDVTSSTPALGCTATPTPLAYRSGARVTCKVFFDGSAGQVRETVLGFTPDAKGTLKLTARAQSPDEESPADNERERSFDVRGAELEVTVSGLPKVEVGTTFDVAVRVLNRGPAKIAHFVASMNLPVDRLELVGPPPTGCGHIDGEIDCEGQLDSGAEKTFTLQLRGKKTGAAIATVLAEQGDPGEAKLSGKLELEVLGPDLAVAHVTSRPSAWLTPPQTGEVDFRVVNKSTTTTADGVRVVMKIDKNTGSTPDCANPLAPVTSEVVQGGCVPGGVAGELTCTLAPGAEATLRFSVKASCAGEATLTVEANPSGAELDKTNNKASAAISVRVPKLGLKILGDPLTQALTIEGPYDALLIGAVEVKDLSGYGVGAGPNADDKIIIDLAPQRPFEFQAITTAGGICQVDPIGGSARCLLDSIGQNATVLIPFDLRSTHGPARGVLPVVASGPGFEVTSTQAPIIARGPDLAVTVLSAPGGKQVDERGEWVVRVFNAGSAAAEHPAITFTQPTGALDLITVDGTTGCNPTDDGRVCTITGPIGPAESVNVTFGARLKKAGDLSIPVRVTSRYEPDEDGTNNTASLTTRVLGPDLAPEIALLPDTAGVGDAVTIQLSVQNKGSVQSPPTAATLQIGPSLNVGVLPPGCAIQQGIALCSVPALAPTQTQVFSVQATTLRPGVFNLVSVVLSPGDSDPSNDKASATLTVTSVDSDGDGIDDSVEDKAPGGGDANGDGTPDRLQPQVTSILIAKHGYLVAEALSGTTLQLTPLTTPPTVPAGHKAPIAPGGLFTFKVSGLTPNARTTVRFTLPPGVPAQSWWKYDDTSAQWSEYTWDAATQTGTTTPSARVLEVTLQDNGRGDEDPTPGVVVDPGAALVKALTVDDARDLADLSPGDGLCATSEGTCTLRAAIEEVNAASSPRYLSFAFAAPTTLALASPLPAITTAVIIDGSDVPGPDPFEPGLTLSGANLTSGPLLSFMAPGSALVGVQLVDRADALAVSADGVRVAGSWLGRQAFGAGTPTVDAALRAAGADELTLSEVWVGRVATAIYGLDLSGADMRLEDVRVNVHPKNGLRPNADVAIGLRLTDSPRALIERLVVHGASSGVVLRGDQTGTTLRASLFGLGANGQCNAFTRDDPGPSETGRGPCLDRNREGLVLDGAHGATIGGLDPADGNTFGDHIDAILIKGGSHDNHLYNNLVGLAADGTCQPAPDIGVGTLYDGLCRLYNVRGLALESGHDNVIGAPGAGNIFGVGTLEVTGGQTSGNLIQANFIGLFADLVTPVRPGFTAMVQAPLHIGGGATLTTIDDNTLSGLEVVGDGTDDTVISNNRIGLLPSGLALPGPDTAFATYWRVWSSGVLVRDGPARVTLSDNTIADTTEACVRVEGLELTVDEVRVADNVLGLGADGRGVTSCEGGALEVRNVDAVVFEDNLIGHCGSEFSETFSVACVRLRGGARGSIVEGNVFGLFRDGRVGPWAGVAPLANPIVILEDAPASVIRDNTMLGAPPYAIYDRAAFLGNITTPADGALITGNRIGLDPDGLHRGAPTDHGILAVGPHAKIGGVLAGQGNHIARAGGAGVRVGNVSGVTLRGNVLEDNAGLGVSLGGESPLVNDALDNDGGPNGSQNHPVVTGFLEAPPRALVALSSIPNRTFTIDVYGVSRPDPSGHGEADLWLGEATLSTDPQGQGSTLVTLSRAPLPGERLSAIATGPDGSSELGPAVRPDAVGVADLWMSLYVEPAASNAWGYIQPFVENQGPDIALDTLVEVALPEGVELGAAQFVTQGVCAPSAVGLTCAVGALGPGEVWEANYLVRAAEPGRYPIVSSASSRANDPDRSDDSASADFDVGSVGYLLQMVQWSPYRTYTTHEPATFTATVAKWPIVNRPIPDLELVVTLPAGATFVQGSHPCAHQGQLLRCELGTMANNIHTVTADLTLAFAEPGAQALTVEALTQAPNFQGRQLALLPTLEVIAPPPALGFSMAGPNAPLAPGALATWTATVENLGASALSGVQLVATLPPGLSFRGADVSCGVLGATLVCDPGLLAPGPRSIDLIFEISAAAELAVCALQVTDGNEVERKCASAGVEVEVSQRTLAADRAQVEARLGEAVPLRFVVTSPTGAPAGQVLVEVQGGAGPEVYSPSCAELDGEFTCAHPAIAAGGSFALDLEVRADEEAVLEVFARLEGAPEEAMTTVYVSALEDCGAYEATVLWGGDGAVGDGWSESAAQPKGWVLDFASGTLTGPPLTLPALASLRVGWRAAQLEVGPGELRLEWTRDGLGYEVLATLTPGQGRFAMAHEQIDAAELEVGGAAQLRWVADGLPPHAVWLDGLEVVACVPRQEPRALRVSAVPAAGIAARGEGFAASFEVDGLDAEGGLLLIEASPRNALAGVSPSGGACVTTSRGAACTLPAGAQAVLASGRMSVDGTVSLDARLIAPNTAEDPSLLATRSLWRVGEPHGEGATLAWSVPSVVLAPYAETGLSLALSATSGFLPGGSLVVEVPPGLEVTSADPRCVVSDALRCQLEPRLPGETDTVAVGLRASALGGELEAVARWRAAHGSAQAEQALAVSIGAGSLSLSFDEPATPPAALEPALITLRGHFDVAPGGPPGAQLEGAELRLTGDPALSILSVTGEGASCGVASNTAACELGPSSGEVVLTAQVMPLEAGPHELFAVVLAGPIGASPTATLAWRSVRDCAAHPCAASACEAVSCEAERGCVVADREGESCAPELGCGGVCVLGECLASGPLSCDDGDPCTNDACVEGGCVSTFIPSVECDCSLAPDTSRCEAGAFVVLDGCGEEVSRTLCDDGDACTEDACDAALGCRATPRDAVGCPGCVPTCGAAVCGVDARCGVSCGSCAEGAVCLDGGCVEDPCPAMPVTGCCDEAAGPRAASCSGGGLTLESCGEVGCGWDEASGRWRCGGADAPPVGDGGFCPWGPECETAEHCDDGDPCTSEACVEGRCEVTQLADCGTEPQPEEVEPQPEEVEPQPEEVEPQPEEVEPQPEPDAEVDPEPGPEEGEPNPEPSPEAEAEVVEGAESEPSTSAAEGCGCGGSPLAPDAWFLLVALLFVRARTRATRRVG